jgi:hypothetical protein
MKNTLTIITNINEQFFFRFASYEEREGWLGAITKGMLGGKMMFSYEEEQAFNEAG